MSLIRVTPGDLATASSQIQAAMTVAGEVRSRNSVLAQEAAAAGRGDVEAAIQGFMNAWSYGLQHLMQDGDTLANFLQGAASSYDQAEQNIAQAAQP